MRGMYRGRKIFILCILWCVMYQCRVHKWNRETLSRYDALHARNHFDSNVYFPRLLCHVRYAVLTSVVMKCSIFWDIMPCSPLKVNRRFEEHVAFWFPPAFTLVSCSAYSSTLKMEACSSETSAEFQRTTRCYILEDKIICMSLLKLAAASHNQTSVHYGQQCELDTWCTVYTVRSVKTKIIVIWNNTDIRTMEEQRKYRA
jgi:hypothetical protein